MVFRTIFIFSRHTIIQLREEEPLDDEEGNERAKRFRFPRKMISWATRDEIECDRSVTNWLAGIFAREIKGRKRHTVYEQGNIINVLKHITIRRMNFSTLKQFESALFNHIEILPFFQAELQIFCNNY